MRVDGSDRLQLAPSTLMGTEPQWSPDGKKIAFGSTVPGHGSSVYVVAVDGGPPQRIVDNGLIPSWSPDGNALAYGGWVPPAESGYEIRVIDLRTGNTSVISDSQGKFGPQWSPDGRLLMANTGEAGDLLLFDFQTGKWSELAKGSFVNWVWSQDGKYVYCVESGPGEPRALRIRISDRHAEVITSLKAIRRVNDELIGDGAGAAPDGSLLLTRDVGTQEVYGLNVKWP